MRIAALSSNPLALCRFALKSAISCCRYRKFKRICSYCILCNCTRHALCRSPENDLHTHSHDCQLSGTLSNGSYHLVLHKVHILPPGTYASRPEYSYTRSSPRNNSCSHRPKDGRMTVEFCSPQHPPRTLKHHKRQPAPESARELRKDNVSFQDLLFNFTVSKI